MKCLILVGGYGTRLRPLTLSAPKPLVPFCNMPIVEHQIAAAARAGVDEVVLAVGYQPQEMMESLASLELKYKVKISCSIEEEPLGTAGPIRLAEKLLSLSDEFLVFNSDVICDFPLSELISFHRSHRRQGTICVTRVEDPSKYGVVVFDSNSGKIDRFVEKPTQYISDQINAGLYILNRSVIDRIPANNFCMFEKDVFPQMAAEGQLYCHRMAGYWADIGQPRDYLQGMKLHLAHLAASSAIVGQNGILAESEEYRVIGNVFVHETARIGRGCVLGPDVTLGQNCVIGEGTRIKQSAIFQDTKIGNSTYIAGSIIGWKSRVGNFARIESLTVAGEDVTFGDEIFVNGAMILPHKSLRDSVFESGKILM